VFLMRFCGSVCCSDVVYCVLLAGGVTLLRAAAKNHSRVTVICDPADYNRFVELLASMNRT